MNISIEDLQQLVGVQAISIFILERKVRELVQALADERVKNAEAKDDEGARDDGPTV